MRARDVNNNERRGVVDTVTDHPNTALLLLHQLRVLGRLALRTHARHDCTCVLLDLTSLITTLISRVSRQGRVSCDASVVYNRVAW